MTEFSYEDMSKLVKSVAYNASKNFPSYVTAQDTEGAIWIWVYEKRSWLEKVHADGEGFLAKISGPMRKVAFDYCNKEKAEIEGYSPDDLYRYSIPKVRTLLLDVFQYQDWQSFGTHRDGQPTAKAQVNQTGDQMAELVDVKIALSKMHRDAQDLLILQFKYGYKMEDIATTFGISEDATKKRSQRAIAALQRQLGRWDPDALNGSSDRRTVRTNAASRAALQNEYEG